MNLIRLHISGIILFICGSINLSAGNTVTDSLMTELEKAIANRPVYYNQKMEKLRSIRKDVSDGKNFQQKYDAWDAMFNEYHSFNTDSAYAISCRQADMARQIGDTNMEYNAILHKADIMSAIGMYHEAMSILDTIPYEKLPDYLLPYYYHINRTLYGYLADYAGFASDRARYAAITDSCRNKLLEVNQPGSFSHTLILADQLNAHHNPEKALKLLEDYISSHDENEHELAIMAWTMSDSYRQMGLAEKQKEQLLRSSISDMKSSVREYLSLRDLALMLYDEGDLDRAYRFLTIAMEDAKACNARQRIVELNKSYPDITRIYIDKVHSQKRYLTFTLILVGVLSVMLALMLLLMKKEMQRRARTRRAIEAANIQLNLLNDQLKASNGKLTEAAAAIAENSALKEVYICRYMDQCLYYIEKLDSFRKGISKLANSGKSDDLKKLVKSTTMVDQELKQFYAQFDSTFLNLFPSFVEEFNQLLQPQEAIIPNHPGSLTPELRIFALIRLGITDSDRIAKFLHYSLTTIYNYRTKVRNKSLGDRNLLESAVMRIGVVKPS